MLLSDISLVGRWAGFLALLFLPGAWVSFGLRISGLRFWPRLFTGTMLSPLVVLAEFYVIRALGASFERTALILVIVNLPALYLIKRSVKSAVPRNPRAFFVGLLTVALCCGSLAPQIARPQWRMYLAQTWLYVDAAYGIARGSLIPEDPQFAGEQLAYPVPGELVYRAVLGYELKSTPATSYIWANLVWLIATCGFAVSLVTELGGGYVARLTATLWLLFGINPVGDLIHRLLRPVFSNGQYRIWGDYRYTSWLLKYVELNTMPVVLGMFIAMAYLLLRFRPCKLGCDLVIILTLLLSSIGMLYPILFPAGCALLGAAAVVGWLEARERGEKFPWQMTVRLAIILLVAVIVTFGHLHFLMAGRRMAGGAVHLSAFSGFARKSIELLIAITPLLVALAVAWKCCWESRRSGTFFLLLGALGSAALNVLFYLPYYSNEYKYVFTLAICLAPFGALAMDRVAERLPRLAAVSVISITLAFLVQPYVWRMIEWKGPERVHPATDTRGFYLRLDSRERLAGICDAIRTETSPDTILVVARADVHFPTVTERSMYVAPEQSFPFDGVNQMPDVLLIEIRGYPQHELDARRATVAQLFAGDAKERLRSLSRILELGRPVAILLEPQDNALLSWLEGAGQGVAVYQQNGSILWLVPPLSRPQP